MPLSSLNRMQCSKIEWNLNQHLIIFIKENVFENVWKMADILFSRNAHKQTPQKLFMLYRTEKQFFTILNMVL